MDHQVKASWQLYSTPEKKQIPDSLNKSANRTTTSQGIRSTAKQVQFKIDNIKQKSGSRFQSSHQNEEYDNRSQNARKSQHIHVQQIHYECKYAERYQHQIQDLKAYLQKSSQPNKAQILRIFGLGYNQESKQFMSQQQMMLKQLSKKVQNLVRQNSRLKQKSIIASQSQRFQAILAQNQRYKRILEDYKNAEVQNTQGLLNQNRRLSNALRNCEAELRVYQAESNARAIQISQTEKNNWHNQQSRKLIQQNRRLNEKLLQCQNALRNCQAQLNFSQNEAKTRVQYVQVQKRSEPVNLQAHKNLLNIQLSQFYKSIELKNNRVNEKLNSIEERINYANKSISHLQFQREVRIQNTIRKSKNFAESLGQSRGDNQIPMPVQFQQVRTINSPPPQPSRFVIHQHIVTQKPRTVEKSGLSERVIIRSDNNERIKVLEQRNRELFRQTEQLVQQLRIRQADINQRVQRILYLQAQLNKSQHIITQLSTKVNEGKNKTTTVSRTTKHRNYSSDVKNIKQFLVSCNPVNFEKFQQQFREIINQRNQLYDQLERLKASKFDRQQYLANQKALSHAKRRVQQLQLFIQNLNRQVKLLSQRCERLEKQNQDLRANDIMSQIELLKSIKNREPEGINGLEWQKIVRRCIQQTSVKLIRLQEEMLKQESLSEVREVSQVMESIESKIQNE